MLTGGLMLLLGCSAPGPEPASAEAVERAVTEAELQRDAVQGDAAQDEGKADPAQAEKKST